MFKGECKHVSTQKQKTQTKICFAFKKDLDDLDLIQIENAKGYLIFSPDQLKTKVEDAMRDIHVGVEKGSLSPSKRLRGSIYQLWFKKFQDKYQWEDYYIKYMRKIEDKVNEQIPE